MNGFSPSVTLAGMDYIAPSAECVNPTFLQNSKVLQHQGKSEQVGAGRDKLKITLQDCLACSGCVTTSETILITSQSREKIETSRQENTFRPWLVSISTQSAASLAGYWGVSVEKSFSIISGFIRDMCKGEMDSILFVVDLLWAQSLASAKTNEEYKRRMETGADLPLITSACPGLVCYCEKQGSSLLPYLSPVLSPQGIAGSYAKRVISADIFHLSIQPCFDRKLEAARDSDENGLYFTDCVISTAELLNWMNDKANTEREVSEIWSASLDSEIVPLFTQNTQFELNAPPSVSEAHIKSSDGYHLSCVEEMLNQTCEIAHLSYETGRNQNLLKVRCQELPKQMFCVAYGFQQIQNIVRGITKKLSSVKDYTFIELMACPGGCLNGGGQVRDDLNSEVVLARVHDKFSIFDKKGSGVSQEFKMREGEDDRPLAHRRAEECPFIRESILENISRLGQTWFQCKFTDRQKEFETKLNQGNIHSLKW